MRRRDVVFLTLVGGAASSSLWPLDGLAQQSAMPIIGMLSGTHRDEREIAAVWKGLAEEGFREGRNVAVEYRTAEGHYDRLLELAADLVRRRVSVILATGGTASALAAKAATPTIPVVFSNGGDPVKTGIVPSLNRPGGNVTGVSFFVTALGAKRLEALRELVPKASAIGFLANPDNPNVGAETADVQAAARALERQIVVQNAPGEADIDAAFARFAQQRVDALIVAADAFYLSRREQLAALAARHGLPTVYPVREHVEAGGLLSYGTDRADAYRQGGVYTGKILKGARPSDLPVMQSTKFELVINLKTAKALGLTVPPPLLARADEVIE